MNTNSRAAILIVSSMTMISSNDAILKISSQSLGVGQLLFIRGMFAAMLFMLIIRLTGRPVISGSVVNRWNLFRATCECLATFCFVTSLGVLPIATASTLVWTAPIFLTICSALFLGEKVSISRWVAVFVGFIGVLLVTNPFGGDFSWVMVLPMMSAGFVVVRDMTTRRIDNEVHSVYIVLATLLLVGLVGGLTSFFDWRTVNSMQLSWLVLSACLLSTGFYFQIKAVRMGEMSFIAPFLFTGILVAMVWGYLIWDQIPNLTMTAGIVLIIGSGLYVLTGQRMSRRRLRTMQPH